MPNAEVSLKEEELLKRLREIRFGQVTVFIQEGQPVRIEKTTESIKLT